MARNPPRTAYGISPTRSCGSPESSQGADVWRVPQFFEGSLANLANAFPGNSQQCSDFLQSQGLGALFQPVVERQDFPLPRREVALEDAVDELALETHVGHLLDLYTTGTGNPFAEGARPAVLTLHRS